MKIVLSESQRLWVTSDIHYSHKNIVEGISAWEKGRGQRPFKTLEEMNAELVAKINLCAAPNDILLILGDVAFGGPKKITEFREKIACNDIRLVLGNHDHDIRLNKGDTQPLFSKICTMTELRIKDSAFVLCHFPLATYDGVGRNVIHLHGHTHKRPERRFGPGKIMDVGVDGSSAFNPYNIDEVIDLMKDKAAGDYLDDDYHKIEGL